MATAFDVVIVGAGHGGAQAAIALRQHGFSGSIAIIGDEAEFPYERPPLSKEYLAGERAFERLLIRPPGFWADRAVELLLGRRVMAVDPGRRTVTTENGATLGYGVLIWAAGGAPRRLTCPGHDLAGVHAVRTRADVDRMIDELDDTDSVGIVGGGYIGLEAAAVLTKLGKRVTVFETQHRVLARMAGTVISDFIAAEHRARGVDFRLNATVDGLVGVHGRVSAVRLADGEYVACGMVIVGIGISPAIGPLAAAGAECGDGLLVDENCGTSLPDIYAIGDSALHHNLYADAGAIRLESVQNANDMATIAAKAICGKPQRHSAVPWFWSNQYDLKLQTVGLSGGYDREVVRGDVEARSFSVIYLRAGRVLALDCVNAVRDYVQGRLLLHRAVDFAALADPNMPLKALAEASVR